MAFVAVLLVGIAILLLGHAGVVIGLAAERSARDHARAAGLDAHLAARLVSAARTMESLDDPLPDGVEGRRLTPELLRLRDDSAGRGAVALLWAPDPQTRLDALGGGVRSAEAMSARASLLVTSESDSCGPVLSVPEDFASEAAGPWEGGDSPVTVGPLDSAHWAALPPIPPAPGSTASAWRGRGNVTLGGGTWRGLLVVFGDLELRAGAVVQGWVATTGDVVVGDGATIEGVVRSGGSVDIDPGGRVDVAPCRAVATLRQLPDFALPVIAGPAGWHDDPRR